MFRLNFMIQKLRKREIQHDQHVHAVSTCIKTSMEIGNHVYSSDSCYITLTHSSVAMHGTRETDT